MKARTKLMFAKIAVCLSVFFGLAVGAVFAEECAGTSPHVCVDRPGDPPQEGFDFIFDLTDPDNPDVELLTGGAWTVWSEVSASDSNPDNLGDITIDPSFNSSEDFDLTIQNGAGAGAVDIGSIVLNDTDWTGHSSIAGGNITGDLNGDLTLIEDSAAAGGTISFTIGGDLVGDATIPHGAGFTIEGLFGTLFGIPTFAMCVDDIVDGALTIEGGTDHAFITIGDKIDAGTLQIGMETGTPGAITIESMVGASTLRVGYLDPIHHPSAGVVMIINSDLPSASVIDLEDALVTQGSKVDFGTNDILGTVTVYDLSGKIVAGDVSGTIDILTRIDDNFGLIDLSGSLSGTIKVNSDETESDVEGNIEIAGAITSTGSITVFDSTSGTSGSLLGNIDVGTDMAGSITVQGDAVGDMLVGGDVTGSIDVGGKLESTGRILIEGLADGAIAIAEETVRTSLIRAIDGLGTNGSITINDGAENFNANGTIHLGPTAYLALPPITFDGSIMIKKDGNGSGGGALFGDIDVIGCHDPADQLDICICCTTCPSTSVTVFQDDCDPLISTPEWACLSGCP